MSKRKYKIISMLVLGILAMQVISAAGFDFDFAQQQVSRVIDSGMGLLTPFFEKILGESSSSEFFFHQLLILLLLILITKKILDKTPIGENNAKISFLVSVIVSILAVRFIVSNNFFESIFLQYGVLGIAITTVLPMVIFFWFIHATKIGTYGRKLFWLFYIIVLVVLWLTKAGEIPAAANWIYVLTILGAIALIFFDKNIHVYFGTSHLRVFMTQERKEAIARAKERIQKIMERERLGIISHYEASRELKELEKTVRELSGEL